MAILAGVGGFVITLAILFIGFYGRVRVNEIDLRPWTFVDANTIVSGRIDRAAIGIDIVRGRLARGPADLGAMISGSPAKFGRS